MGAAGASSGYTINNSVYGDGSTGYFSRTFGAASSNLKTGTVSCWVKRTNVGATQKYLIYAVKGASATALFFLADNTIRISAGATCVLVTNQVFRDTSAFFMLTVALDTTQATASDRVKLYKDGTQITSFSSATYPSLNEELAWGDATQHTVVSTTVPSLYATEYVADFKYINGQALTPSSFGETDTTTGSWKPKRYSGAYGTNGFYLPFTNSSSLGDDTSGNGNNFTKTGTVTQTTDSPTDKAASNIGNYCTFNPLRTDSNITLSNGNLTAAQSVTANWNATTGTLYMPTSGKYYFEMKVVSSDIDFSIGVGNNNIDLASHPGSTADGWCYFMNGRVKYNNGSFAYGNATSYTYGVGTTIGVAIDMNLGAIWFSAINAGTQNWIDGNGTDSSAAVLAEIVAGTTSSAAFTTITVPVTPVMGPNYNAGSGNFIPQPAGWVGTAPTGFKAICTANLPAPTIKKPTDYVRTGIYTGTGATLNITGLDFQPDIVFIDRRDASGTSCVFNSVRGTGVYVAGDATGGEVTDANSLTSFNSGGFTLGTSATVNTNGGTYYYTALKAGGASGSNANGSITSTVSVNTTAKISVGTFTGTGANATVGHGLGATPAFVWITQIHSGAATNRIVWHKKFANTEYIQFSGNTIAKTTGATTHWNSTSPTSSVFSVGTSNDTNQSAKTYMFIAFGEVDGFSKAYDLTGNGNADGPFVWCGFRSQLVVHFRADATTAYGNHWYSSAIDTYNPSYKFSYFGISSQTENPTNSISVFDIVSNGLKLRASNGDFNATSGVYCGFAFAEFPFGGTGTTQGKAR